MSKLLPEWVDPTRTALLLIDMQVDFGAPDGVLGKAGLDMTAPAAAIAQSERLLAAARKAGVTPIFIGLQTSAKTDSPSWKEWMRRRGQNADSDSGICRVGTHGAEFVGPKPEAGDLVIGKLRYSSFFGTALDATLKARGITTLVVCGLTTECCIDCTVRDAFHLDYHVFIATDACAAYDPAIHRNALDALALNCAMLFSTDEILQAWTPKP